ncbi:MAG: HlyD family secretion protein, partial [Pseudoxanthomonas sp.]
MNRLARHALPIALTALAVIAAAFVLVHLWHYYMDAPWTRDAHVNADVVQVAPDVSGRITEVDATDNQAVKRGQPLFVVDPARYRIAVEQAGAVLGQRRAAVAEAEAAVAQLRRETARDRGLQDLVAAEDAEAHRARLQAAQATLEAARAAVQSAQAALDLANLDLARTVVRSPVDGRLSDRTVRVGDYVGAGKPVTGVVDAGSYRIDGYFEETRLRRLRVGQAVDIALMGERDHLHGHVASIAAGIEDRYRSDGASQLPNVTPAFDWVRLAQRIPVRIAIDQVPKGVRLIAGRTATVSVRADAADDQAGPARAPAAA